MSRILFDAFDVSGGNKTVTVKPSGQGGTYTSLQAAITGEVAANPNLITMGGILTISIEGTWSSADTTNVSLTGFTTDATHYVNVITDSANRASPFWSTSKYRLSYTGSNDVFSVTQDYTRITGLQTEGLIGSGNYVLAVYNSGGSGLPSTIDSCFIRSLDTTPLFTARFQSYNYMLNCIIMGGVRCFQPYGASSRISNCLFIGGSQYALDLNNNIQYIKNCYAYNTANGAITNYTGASLTTCYTNDGSASTSIAAYTTSTFINVTSGSENLNLAAGSSLIGTGTDLSADYIPFNWDMTGATRSSWDVGVSYFSGISGIISSTLKKITSQVSGIELFSGALAVNLKKQTTSGIGSLRFSGAITSSAKKVTLSLSGNLKYSGTIVSSGKKVTSVLAGNLKFSGAITASTKKVTSVVLGSESFTGTIASLTKKIQSAMAGTSGGSGVTGTIASSTKKVTLALSGSESFTGTAASSTKKVTSVIAATLRFSGAIASNTKKIASVLSGNNVSPFTGTIASSTKKTTLALLGSESFTGSIASNTKKTTLLGSGSLKFTGIIAGSSKKTASTLSGNVANPVTGTVASSTKKLTLVLSGTLKYSGMVSSSTKKITISGASNETFSGALSSNNKKVSYLLSGVETFSGSGTILGKKIAVSASGTFGLYILGNIASSIKKSIPNIQAHSGGYNYSVTIKDDISVTQILSKTKTPRIYVGSIVAQQHKINNLVKGYANGIYYTRTIHDNSGITDAMLTTRKLYRKIHDTESVMDLSIPQATVSLKRTINDTADIHDSAYSDKSKKNVTITTNLDIKDYT
jgi:hypothetical protein